MSETTHQLVQNAKAGDQAAYERLFERFAGRLLLYVRLRLGSSLKAKLDPYDVLQETYLSAHRSFGDFELQDEHSFSHWLHRIARNRIHDLVDHFGAHKRKAPGVVEGSGVIDRIRASQTGPSTAFARAEQEQQLERAMADLDDREREALLLRYFEGQSLEQIGKAQGCSRETVRTLLGHARVKLGAALPPG